VLGQVDRILNVQNTTGDPKRYRLTIVNQPAGEGGRASFRQFDINRKTGEDRGPLSALEAEIPRRSTIARTVYVKALEQYAQVLVNVEELLCVPPADPPECRRNRNGRGSRVGDVGGPDGRILDPATPPYAWITIRRSTSGFQPDHLNAWARSQPRCR
jgi:hypothetical protein